MNASWLGDNRRWVASAAGALIVFTLMLGLLRVARVPAVVDLPPSPESRPAIEVAPVAGGDRILQEATIMHDQRPLFLPTERNVALRPLVPPEPGSQLLGRDEERLSFSPRGLTLRIPPPITVPEKTNEAILDPAASVPLHGFARSGAPILPLDARGALVEVFAAETNQRVIFAELPISARPPTEKSWRPLELTAAVDAAGLVGSLVITERSDVEEVEKYFRNYLAQTFRLGERLPPGFYRVVVGP